MGRKRSKYDKIEQMGGGKHVLLDPGEVTWRMRSEG